MYTCFYSILYFIIRCIHRHRNIFFSTFFVVFLSLVYIIMEWIEVTLSCRDREISFAGSGSIATLYKMGFMQWTESGGTNSGQEKSFRSQNSVECRPAYTNNFHVYFSLYFIFLSILFFFCPLTLRKQNKTSKLANICLVLRWRFARLLTITRQ
jgi:quinol-cytochrome oxidoreductase complex cytochrome b subunit